MTAKTAALAINWVLIFMLAPHRLMCTTSGLATLLLYSSNDIHRFRLNCLQGVHINIIIEKWYLFFRRQIIGNHPASFVFHGYNERVIEGKREMVSRLDGRNLVIGDAKFFLHYSLGFERMLGNKIFRLV